MSQELSLQGTGTTYSREFVAPEPTWLTRAGDLLGGQREVPEHRIRIETESVNI